MTNINEKSEWSTVIQLEDGDVLKGGENGLANSQAKSLVNRTAQLKNSVEAHCSNESRHIPEGGAAGQVIGKNAENALAWVNAGSFAGTSGNSAMVVSQGNPLGTIIQFAGSDVPADYMECKGQTLSKTEYSGLFEAIGYTWGGSGDTFKLPDFYSAGRFLRSRSASLVVGTTQEDAIRNITGHIGFHGGDVATNVFNASGVLSPINTLAKYRSAGDNLSSASSLSGVNVDASRVVPTANENRPKNAVVMYCIKVIEEELEQTTSSISGWRARQAFEKGQIIFLTNGKLAECVKASFSGDSEPDWSRYMTNVLVLDGGIEWIVTDIRFGRPEVGEFAFKMWQTIKRGYKIADGKVLTHVSERYPMLVEYLNDNPWLNKSEVAWQQYSTTAGKIGGVPYYVFNSSADTIRLPDLRDMYQRGSGTAAVGTFQGDAIRNITGKTSSGAAWSSLATNDTNTLGAFYPMQNGGGFPTTGGSNATLSQTLGIDASRVVPTANENRPKTINYLPVLYVGGEPEYDLPFEVDDLVI